VKPTIFQQPFWLDAVAPGRWHAVEVRLGGARQAWMPYVLHRGRVGQRVIRMPHLTQTLGPWIGPSRGKPATQLARQHELMTALIERLPPFDEFVQNLHPAITSWLPFYWQGFQQTTRYSYVLEELGDTDAIWAGFRENIRRAVRKAERELAVRDDLGLDVLLDLAELTFARQGRSLPFGRETVARIEQACAQRGCHRMLFAQDERGRVHAGIYVVWDDETSYYLIGGADPALRGSGATSLLLWTAIQQVATTARRFDFEGSMQRPIERYFRAFGARQQPYLRVSKVNARWLRAARDVRSWLARQPHG
jgi:hypothetical protein